MVRILRTVTSTESGTSCGEPGVVRLRSAAGSRSGRVGCHRTGPPRPAPRCRTAPRSPWRGEDGQAGGQIGGGVGDPEPGDRGDVEVERWLPTPPSLWVSAASMCDAGGIEAGHDPSTAVDLGRAGRQQRLDLGRYGAAPFERDRCAGPRHRTSRTDQNNCDGSASSTGRVRSARNRPLRRPVRSGSSPRAGADLRMRFPFEGEDRVDEMFQCSGSGDRVLARALTDHGRHPWPWPDG